MSPVHPWGQQWLGSPSPWHQPSYWGSRAASSKHLSSGQMQPPLPEQALSVPGRRTCYLQPNKLRGAHTPPHVVLRNQWVEKPALNMLGCPYLLDLLSDVQEFNFDLHSTFGACMVPCIPGTSVGSCSQPTSSPQQEQGCGLTSAPALP